MSFVARILSVLDSDEEAQQFRRALDSAGVTTEWTRADRFQRVSSLLTDERWDLIITDSSVKGFKGLDVIKAVRTRGLPTPVVVVSDAIDAQSAISAMRLGARDYIAKGQIREFVDTIKRELSLASKRIERPTPGKFSSSLGYRSADYQVEAGEIDGRFQVRADLASDAVISIDENSTVLYANSACEAIFGYSPAELVGNSLTILMSDSVGRMHVAGLKRFIESGKRKLDWQLTESTALRKDGAQIDIQISFGYHGSGDRHFFTGFIRDVSSAKNAESELRRSEANFRALVQATTQYIWQLDEQGNIAEYPHWWESLTGQSFKQSVNFGWLEPVHPDDRLHVRDTFMEAIAKGERATLDLRIRSKDGSYRFYVANAVPLPAESGTRWICALGDLTELRSVEERFRLVSNMATDYMFESTRHQDGRFLMTWVAGAFERITGYTAALLNETGGWHSIVHPEDRQKDIEDFNQVAANRHLDSEIRIIHRDGHTVWVRILAQPILNPESGLLTGICGAVQDITERKTAEIAVRESADRLAAILDAAPECVKVLSPDSRIVEINPAGLRILGASSVDEVQGGSPELFMKAEHVDGFRSAIARVMKGESVEYTYELKTLKGDWKWLEMQAVPLRSDSGEITSVLGVSRDITENRRAQIELAKSELRYRVLFENSPYPMFVYDVETLKFLAVNDSAIQRYGYSRREFLSMSAMDIRPEEDVPAFRESIDVNSVRLAAHGDWRHKLKDGTLINVEITSHALEWEGRKARIVLAHDISDRMKADQMLKKSEAKYRELFENANDIIYTHDLTGRITSLNRAGERAFGYTEEEALGFNIADILEPKFLIQVKELMGDTVEGTPAKTYETEAIAKDGRRVPLEISARLIFDEKRPTGVQGIARDITERRAGEEALRASEEQLKQAQKLESVGILAGGLAHDFNNMLTAINGYSDLVLRKLAPNDPIRKNVEEIRKAGERSAELTSQLLAFSRRQILQPQIIDLNYAIDETSSLLERLIGEDITILKRLDPNLPPIEADPGQLSQVLMNLAVNSRDAMPSGGSLLITTSSVMGDEGPTQGMTGGRRGPHALLAIADTGAGMDEDTLSHIFEPFFTTKAVGRGTGLGLSTVYGIVKQSGGNIWAYSAPGMGTTFKIYFPAAQAISSVGTGVLGEQNEMFIGSGTIMLVEDEGAVRELARKMLESCGYRVIVASDGVDALSKFDEVPIDLLITDVVMPRMGGRELSDILSSKHPELQILFTSGYTDDAIIRLGIREDGKSFLQKPFTLESLAKKVGSLLDAAREKKRGRKERVARQPMSSG